MILEIENDFKQKIMTMSFKEPVVVDSKASFTEWKQAWLKELASWHSPYKLLLNCSNLRIVHYEGIKGDFDLFYQFFKGFFLRKAVAFGFEGNTSSDIFPFECKETYEEACEAIGIRANKTPVDPKDFRGQIQIENDFRQHVMELSFASPVAIDTIEHVQTLKSKVMNNLMQWHSKWNLLIDCHQLTIAEDMHAPFMDSLNYFKAFFMSTMIGYSPKNPNETYPFKVYRSRHRAVTQLERIGAMSGNEAHCQSKKSGS